jgi:excisionase family DNA binding protein
MRFFTIVEVVEIVEVATRTVRRWIRSGDLVAHRFGGVVRISEDDLQDFLNRHRDDEE